MADAPKVTSAPLSIGRYQVTDRLGEGGMGIVYLARDPSLERFVAIKLMRAGFDSPDLRERFVKEARAVASLRHPCIVTLYEYGDHQGQPFIVMEYVNGKTLASLIGDGTPLSLARRMQLTRDLCLGLEHAHKAGIIHRDIKPANIMVDGEGTLKILDFGIAKLGHAGTTQVSALVGTPRYMSPEQISGKPVTRRSDIFSVGLVIYELLASKAAYEADNQFAVMDAILHRDPVPLATQVPALDPRIARIVEKALEKDPDRRYQDLSQMRREVERICNELALVEPSSTTRLQLQRQPFQLEELGRRRMQQIESNLENAERAFELGDYDAALAACEDALIIDPQDARALEGLQRAQAAMTERQAFAHLSAARQHFANQELSLAEEALRAAFELAPELREGLALREQLGSARQKKEQRGRAVKLALDRARIRFGEGAFESAINAANEALDYDPQDSAARRLKAEALVALEADQRQREIDRRAQVTVDQATRLAARDRYDEALRLLANGGLDGHPLVAETRRHIESAHEEFERLRRDAIARREAARLEAARLETERLETEQLAIARLEIARLETARLETARLDTEGAAAANTVIAPPMLFQPPMESDEPTLAQPGASPSEPRQTAAETSAAAVEPRWVIAPMNSPGFLPGPVRARKPKPTRRPVRFLDEAPDHGGAREWFHDQLFVGVKQGHDSVGFGVSATTHVIVIAVGVVALILRPVSVTPPPDKAPLVMLTAAAPRPMEVDSTPPAPTDRPKPRAPRSTSMPQPISSAPPPPETTAAPIEAPPDIAPPNNTVTPIGPVVTLQPPKPLQPLPSGGLEGIVDETPVTDFDQGAAIINRVKPKLPVGATGVVRVEVTVLSNGRVSRVKVLDQTPYAALISDAASQCTFRPARRRGKPVTVTVTLQYNLDTKQ